VVMPVFNAQVYISEAINSILGQTFSDFEFIIVDDASDDKSWKIIQSFALKDKRIKIFRNEKKMGVSITVKRAIDQATGKYLARMDADDISFPTRIEKQINYLKTHKKTVAIGTQCLIIDSKGKEIGTKIFPTSFDKIYKYIYRFVPLQQPSLMIARKRLPKDFVYYIDGMNSAEEVELIFKLFVYGKVENHNETLLKYRMHDKNTSLNNVKETFLLTLLSRIRAVFLYGYRPATSGIIITFIQTLIVLILPQKMVLYLYKNLRNGPKITLQIPSISLKFRYLFSKI